MTTDNRSLEQFSADNINAEVGDHAKNVTVGKNNNTSIYEHYDNSVTINNNGSIGKLIDTVRSVIGIGNEPISTVLNAWADGQAMKIRAQATADVKRISLKSEMEVRKVDLHENLDLDMWHRAMNRFANVELRRQSNLEGITLKAIPFLPSSASSEPVDEDWVFAFCEHSQDISDEQMQEVWARILAGEVEKPGSFSKRTLQAVRVLSSNEAHLFKRCCPFVWNGEAQEDKVLPIIFTGNEGEPSSRAELTFSDLQILQAAGLMFAGSFSVTHPSNLYHIEYFGNRYLLTLRQQKVIQFRVGKALFTDTGKELLQMFKPEPDREYEQNIIEYWRNEEKLAVEKL